VAAPKPPRSLVIPSLPSANTNTTVYAIAERAADLIREGSK
jgi:choline dehydrogenase-like flavoprotein